MNKIFQSKNFLGKKAYLNGINAEAFVENYFVSQNYHILEQRFRCQYGEVDLIISKDNWLIFVEVKFRRDIENALSALNSKQLSRLINTAEYFIAEYDKKFSNIRFDLLAINSKYDVNHIKNITF